MKNFFSMESKVYQLLMQAAEVILLNLLYLLFCLPIFTIGAAQAGMMNAVRIMQDKENDRSIYRAFFRGFVSGFGKITIIWMVCFAFIGALAHSALAMVYYNDLWGNAPLVMPIAALIMLIVYQSMAVSFHSKFDCSIWQILRSAFFLILMHPIKAVIVAVAIWAPLVVFLLNFSIFLTITPVFMFIYYTLAFYLATNLMKAPFDMIEAEKANSG